MISQNNIAIGMEGGNKRATMANIDPTKKGRMGCSSLAAHSADMDQ